jgi:hypothetical protein
MQAEERNVGAVNLQVYKRYFQSGNGALLLPIMFVTIVLMQDVDRLIVVLVCHIMVQITW